ncbi:TA system VapC family ribonuclease toxin [Actinophytocola gossypii]|uniref:Ribonuclease VapC n=1 Tax=Actinophytocola gossypii TaxID=2812003 RepID=A0ABT2J515_9PSEU|nr:TA system VapC family ribonuclease toxin [Actinophytocola gossypii]MCT2582354.1 PIN domain-containing protein [Actinophytocola gossypii]
MTNLLDANVLIALVVVDHVHHPAAETWLAKTDEPFATCPITQSSLVRLLIREGQSAVTAQAILAALAEDGRHEFWADDVSYRDVPLTGVIGHRQVTDTYLAQVARQRDGRLVTFDQGLAEAHPDVAELVPVGTPLPRSGD